jgi:hypothetical protein
MSDTASLGEARRDYAGKIFNLLIECRNKIPIDCSEQTLILSDEALRKYAKGIESVSFTHRTDHAGYHQVASDLIERITMIRDDLPAEWREFSEFLSDATDYPQGILPNNFIARPLSPPSNPTTQFVPLPNGSVTLGALSAAKTPMFETGLSCIDPALLAIDKANEQGDMEIDTDTLSDGSQEGAAKVSTTNTNTAPPVTATPLFAPRPHETNNGVSSWDTVMDDILIGSVGSAQGSAAVPVQKASAFSKSAAASSDGASIFRLPGIAASFPVPSSFTFATAQPASKASELGNTFSLSSPMFNPTIGKKAAPIPSALAFGGSEGQATNNPFVGPDGTSIFSKVEAQTKPADNPFPSITTKAPERKIAPLKKSSRVKSTAGEPEPGGSSASVMFDANSAEKALSPAPVSKPIFDFGALSTLSAAPSKLQPSSLAEPKGKKSRHTPSPPSSSPSPITKDGTPPKVAPSSASSQDSVTSKSTSTQTGLVVSTIKDGTLEKILSLLEEERTARVEADTKRVDAETKQKQAYEAILERVASLEKDRTLARDGKQKELDEREAAVFQREEAAKAHEASLAAREEAFTTKAQVVVKDMSRLQERADRLEAEAEARLAKTLAPGKAAAKQKEPVKPTVPASTAIEDGKVVSEIDKGVGPKRKSTTQIVRILKKEFSPEKAHVVFDKLKRGALQISGIGKAKPGVLQAQIEKVLRAFEAPASTRKEHASMVVDLVNFGYGLVHNDERYLLVDTTVKNAAAAFAEECLADQLFKEKNWAKFSSVLEQHKRMSAIKTILRLETSLSDMNLALSSAEAPDEFDEDISATPTEIVGAYFNIFGEYESAFSLLLAAVPESSPLHMPLKTRMESEVLAVHNAWTEAARKFGY